MKSVTALVVVFNRDETRRVMLAVMSDKRPCSMIDAEGRLHVRPNKRKDVVLSSAGKVKRKKSKESELLIFSNFDVGGDCFSQNSKPKWI